MSENDDLARVMLGEGFCTQDQIDRCRHIQSSTDERLSLGQSLLREGFVTGEQYSRALVLLRQGYKKERDTAVVRRAGARQGQEDRVLGGILIAEGWISAGQLNDCVIEGQKSGRPLAEILVALGHLESARVDSILDRLEKMDLSCPSCQATLSILRLPTGEPVRCPRCRNVVGVR
jgi:hypothetical protein